MYLKGTTYILLVILTPSLSTNLVFLPVGNENNPVNGGEQSLFGIAFADEGGNEDQQQFVDQNKTGEHLSEDNQKTGQTGGEHKSEDSRSQRNQDNQSENETSESRGIEKT